MKLNSVEKALYKIYADNVNQSETVLTDKIVPSREWKRTLNMIVPHEIYRNPETTALFTSFFLDRQPFSNQNRLNGVVQYLIKESSELMLAAIMLSHYMQTTGNLKKANPFGYNPSQFFDELEAYFEEEGNSKTWDAASNAQKHEEMVDFFADLVKNTHQK